MEIIFTPAELRVLDRLHQDLDLAPAQVIRQGLRLLQMQQRYRQLGYEAVYRSAVGEIVADPLNPSGEGGCMGED